VTEEEGLGGHALPMASELASGPLAYSLLTVALDRINEAAYLIDELSGFRFVNTEACAVLGYTREELLTLGIAEVDPGFPMPYWSEHWKNVKARASFTTETCHRRKDGSCFPVEINASHFVFEGRDYHLALARDISERKAAEETLRASEARLRRAESVASIGHWELDLTRQRMTASEGAKQVYGLQGTEWPLEEVWGLLQPEFRPKLTQALADLVAGRKAFRVDFQIRRASDGAVRDLQAIAEWDPQKNTVFGISHDLTEQKAVQAELLKSARLNEQILRGAGEGVIVFDLELRHQVWNPFMESMTGKAASEVLGRHPLEVFPFLEATALIARLQRALAGDAPEITDFGFQDPATGEPGWATATLATLRDHAGAPIGLIVMVRDITERVLADRKQARLLAQLQHSQKMESLGQLASGIAHDMNNVLGAILALASANQSQVPQDSKAHQAFATISKAAVRGGEVLTGLLRFARQDPPEARPVKLNEVVQEVVALLEHTALARVHVQLRLAEGLPPLLGDMATLTNALLNLCVNAADAMPGGGSLTLETLRLEDGWLALQVTDTGSGMAKEILDRALEPFFTTKAIGKGTGLGLPMVQATVQDHHGMLTMTSDPGAGTCVQLRFPAQGNDYAVAPPVPVPGFQAASQVQVLLVDDDEPVLASMAAVIKALGHHALAVASGGQALAALQGGCRPDLVILDLNMPGLDGLGTLAALREGYPSLPVLLATGDASQAALDLVAQDPQLFLLRKPFTAEELRDCLRTRPLGRLRRG
jgi:PAS domain S-box-containing protein